MIFLRLKYKTWFLTVAAVFLLLFSFSAQATDKVNLHPTYKSGPLEGQAPEGRLAPNSIIEFVANFDGDPKACTGPLDYKFWRTLAHAKGGDKNKIEYLARGSAEDQQFFDYQFNSGQYGQENTYKAIFYCWSSDNPEIALGTAKQWQSDWFEQTTTGGACTFSQAQWNKTSAKVGDEMELSVKAETNGCKGQQFWFEIWNASLTGRKVTEIEATVPTEGDLPLTITKPWTVAEQITYYFKVRLPGGVNNCAREGGGGPNDPCLKSGTLEVVGVAAGGGGKEKDTREAILEFRNPLAAENFQELLDAILAWLFWLSIPVGVIMLLWAGITMLYSQGNPEKFSQGKKILFWTIAGLAIIFIGEGFIYLIKSILELKNG